jgi:hypothetical protein
MFYDDWLGERVTMPLRIAEALDTNTHVSWHVALDALADQLGYDTQTIGGATYTLLRNLLWPLSRMLDDGTTLAVDPSKHQSIAYEVASALPLDTLIAVAQELGWRTKPAVREAPTYWQDLRPRATTQFANELADQLFKLRRRWDKRGVHTATLGLVPRPHPAA